MKGWQILIYLLLPLKFLAQDSFERNMLHQYKQCGGMECRLQKSFQLAELYLEADEIDRSQKWLEVVKELEQQHPSDTMSYYIQSLQSELFYYRGLYQFGVHEAQKGLVIAHRLKDSALIADAGLFIGINQFELKQLKAAQHWMFTSRRYAVHTKTKRLRSPVREEHIYNNIAQLKMAQHQLDSASWYIKKATDFARLFNSSRGIPNTLQTQGLIYLERNLVDSAQCYLKKSNVAAQQYNFYDVLLINHGYLMKCVTTAAAVDTLFDQGREIIRSKHVNIAFQQLFYTTALGVFKRLRNKDKVILVQDILIAIEAETRLKGNEYIQRISDQYVKSENRLLVLKVEKLNRQRNLALLQLVAALLAIVVLTLLVLIFRRKSKLQQTLLKQKNDISKDLHDDIGSGLSSILIHADLLGKLDATHEKQETLTAKIAVTGKEISQRLSTFIWSLNSENNSLQSFCEYVRQYAATLFEGTGIDFSYEEEIQPGENKILDGHTRKNLFFCIKEVLNNSMKHSGATKIHLHVGISEKKAVQLTLWDNGSGLVQQNHFGNGLKNIQKRIDGLRGTFVLQNDNGLKIILIAPFSNY